MKHPKGPTKPKTCGIPIHIPGFITTIPCGSRRFRAGRCIEHYTDWRNEKQTRWGAPIVVKKWVKPVEVVPEPIATRRKRQGISQDSQDWLVGRAAEKRLKRAYA